MKNKKKSGTPVSFKDTRIAFRHKSDGELFLSYVIFWLTKNPLLVKLLSKAAKLALSLADDAFSRGRKDVARDCAAAGLRMARKSGESELVRRATLTVLKLQGP